MVDALLDTLRPVAIAATPVALWLMWRRRDAFFDGASRREEMNDEACNETVSIDQQIERRAREDAEWALRNFAASAARSAASLLRSGGRGLIPTFFHAVAEQIDDDGYLPGRLNVPEEIVEQFAARCRASVLASLQSIDR